MSARNIRAAVAGLADSHRGCRAAPVTADQGKKRRMMSRMRLQPGAAGGGS